ncbi:hypothetical protein [Streptomyces griseorubiginosus]|uniref:hypothetical protein n=1 Tax=Streptomyces griseorubiginosus TaxID=67304 RepID=UPI00215B6268|nr:hypothetical protein [Streptomyces griseorubiginosus]
MSQQQYPPQQPGWGGPQQPFGHTPFAPPPPKKGGAGKFIGLGCLGLVGLFILIALVGAVVGGGANSNGSKSADDSKAAHSASKGDNAADTSRDSEKKASKKVVVFKVWGTAPAGALGPLNITYGSDSDNRDGTFKDGEFKATLPIDEDALYFDVTAQLQRSGDIHCSVTVGGKTDKGHAAGDYNICSAQLSAGLLGGWS